MIINLSDEALAIILTYISCINDNNHSQVKLSPLFLILSLTDNSQSQSGEALATISNCLVLYLSDVFYDYIVHPDQAFVNIFFQKNLKKLLFIIKILYCVYNYIQAI